ncbi:ALF repeat-containing protein [Streptomyces sp. PTD5-9]|uniref:ALF repeat-containing protein n=1 Tax=Streptomyces sp. PTD5-9 TaxID=3120150 RepID=UPI00300876C1
MGSGGPEVKSAARIALDGSPQMLHAFIASGQYMAQRKDLLAATHVAQVQQMISEAAEIAATAQHDAATAQKVAATARKAAAEADKYAKQAKELVGRAQTYADEATQHAKDAEASATAAAKSANTARDAANNANRAADNAAASAATATVSAENAQAFASQAWVAADQARDSAIAAGKDAGAALDATADAFKIAIKKQREEEEARRKELLKAKEAAENSPGAQARKQYRCGPLDPNCDLTDNPRPLVHAQGDHVRNPLHGPRVQRRDEPAVGCHQDTHRPQRAGELHRRQGPSGPVRI